jgi:hypothetical protein
MLAACPLPRRQSHRSIASPTWEAGSTVPSSPGNHQTSAVTPHHAPLRPSLTISPSHERLSIYTLHSVPMFWNHFDGPFIPTLKLLHRCEWNGPLFNVYTQCVYHCVPHPPTSTSLGLR